MNLVTLISVDSAAPLGHNFIFIIYLYGVIAHILTHDFINRRQIKIGKALRGAQPFGKTFRHQFNEIIKVFQDYGVANILPDNSLHHFLDDAVVIVENIALPIILHVGRVNLYVLLYNMVQPVHTTALDARGCIRNECRVNIFLDNPHDCLYSDSLINRRRMDYSGLVSILDIQLPQFFTGKKERTVR